MNEVLKIIELALRDLYLNDQILISRFTKERAINHWLAFYIDKHIRTNLEINYNVDVEYNRNITDELFDGNKNTNKKIINWTGDNLSGQETIPDIIVHKRGSNDYNHLCVEGNKEYKNKKSANKDFQKIIGLLNEPYNFEYGCIIEYLPNEDYFDVIIIKKVNQQYESEQIRVRK